MPQKEIEGSDRRSNNICELVMLDDSLAVRKLIRESISIWLGTIAQRAAIIAARTNSRASIRQNQKTMTQCAIIWLWTIAQQIAGPQYDNTIPKDKTMTQYASKWLWTIPQHAAIIAARANRDRPRAEKWESDWIGAQYRGHFFLYD